MELGQDSSVVGHNNNHSQIGADKQPRGKRIPPLVSEFKTVVTLSGPNDVVPIGPKFDSNWHIPSNVKCSDPHLSCIPAQARVLRSQLYGGDCNDRRSQDTSTNTRNIREIIVRTCSVCFWGILLILYIPQNILAQEWTFLLACNFFFLAF